jgi:hypothetical protein
MVEKNIEEMGGTRLDEITIQPHTFWQKIFKKVRKEYYLYVSQELYNKLMGILPQPKPCTWFRPSPGDDYFPY